jgi:predicted DNA-binding transcriptional regulator AlpA
MTADDKLLIRDTAWAMKILGYSPHRKCAFWDFVHRNNVPLIRLGLRKIVFSESAILEWLAKRSSTRRL